MIEITSATYAAVARALREAIGTSDFFNGSVEYETPEFSSRLTTTAIVYRRTETLPEGVARPIVDVVPVWWEFATWSEGGEELNDFSFSDLKSYLIDYE